MVSNRTIAIALLLLLTGCKNSPVRHIAESPTVSATPSGGVILTGDAQSPAKVNTAQTTSTLKLPEASTLVLNEKLGTLTVTLSKASEMAVNRTETAVEGPKAFTPDKAPTISEEMDAKSDAKVKIGLYACVLIGGVAGIFGLVRNWNLVMMGGFATAAAGLFGLFVQRHPLILLVVGLGVALKIAGPFLWHTKLKHAKPTHTDESE
jgi:hypothetical protein